MVEWGDKGCPVCRRQWETGLQPPLIATALERHATLHRCPVCATLWEEHERFADVIGVDEAHRLYPEAPLE